MTTESNPNLAVWNYTKDVPKNACRPFDNGRFKGTDINRMWRVKVLTELFGPAGVGWDWKVTETWTYKLDDGPRVVLFAKGELRLMDAKTKMWSAPIYGYGGNDLVQTSKYNPPRINDDAYKMVDTDAFGHACSKLGIGASVYWESEKSKYTPEDNMTESSIPSKDDPIESAKLNSQKDALIDDILWNYIFQEEAREIVEKALAEKKVSISFDSNFNKDESKKVMRQSMNIEQLRAIKNDIEIANGKVVA